jgi:hypothetical protein
MAYLLHLCQLLLNKPIEYGNAFCLLLRLACRTKYDKLIVGQSVLFSAQAEKVQKTPIGVTLDDKKLSLFSIA